MTTDLLLVQQSVIALVLGFMIGLQREMHTIYTKKVTDFAGSRTFSMIALFGMISYWMGSSIPHLFLLALLVLALILVAAYVVNSIASTEKGATTEFTAILTFLIGAMVCFAPPMIPVILTVIILFVLNLKEKIREYEKTIAKEDLSAAILFLMMTVVVLPILPDTPVDPYGLVNLYRIWLMVVLVAGISFLGYIAIRWVGSAHGTGIAGVLGGMISSTAVVLTFARRAHGDPASIRNYALGICLASSVMLLRLLVEVWFINGALIVPLLLPAAAALLAGYVYIRSLLIRADGEHSDEPITFKNPFELKEALVMGLVFGIVLALTELSRRSVGDVGIYAVAFFSGLGDIDAITLSLSTLAKTALTSHTALIGLTLAFGANSLVKTLIASFLGPRPLFRYVAIYHLITVVVFTGGIAIAL